MGKEARGHQQLGRQPFRDTSKKPVKAHVAAAAAVVAVIVVAVLVMQELLLMGWMWV